MNEKKRVRMNREQIRKELPKMIKAIREYIKKAGKKGAVIGNSGGKDCATVIGATSKAIGPENVVAVTLPCQSIKKDSEDAEKVAKAFGVRTMNGELVKAFENIVDAVEENDITVTDEAKVNIKPRLRMAALYAIAQTLDYLVIGTGNACEAYVGYFTKFGDGGYDYNPLFEYSVREVYLLASCLDEMPEFILTKAPADGLGKLTDEEKLGVTYAQIEDVIDYGKTDDPVATEKIIRMHKAATHKLEMPAHYQRELAV